MIQSRSQSPETGMSAGIVSTSIDVALTSGVNAGLKKSPVKFVRQKSEMMAKGANLAERKWGNRGNFIRFFLHVSPMDRCPWSSKLRKLFSYAWPNRFTKNLKSNCNRETGTKMGI